MAGSGWEKKAGQCASKQNSSSAVTEILKSNKHKRRKRGNRKRVGMGAENNKTDEDLLG